MVAPLATGSGADLTRPHLVGIGGVGMSAIASLLLDQGLCVSGSDAQQSTTTERLVGRGARIVFGHDATNIDLMPGGASAVVVSTAVPDDNPELVAARRRALPVVHRAEALAAIMRGRQSVCIAGTHGKTSTSSMLAVALREIGLDPSFAIGGVPASLGVGAAIGTGTAFVAEADESDGSLTQFAPHGAVITTIEPDHLDFHGTAAAYEAVFDAFVARIEPGGFLVAGADDRGVQALLGRIDRRWLPVLTYGSGPGAAVRIVNVQDTGQGSRARFDVTHHGPVSIDLGVPGRHMVANAAAVVAVGVGLGIAPERMAAGLRAYTGVGRRFELRGEIGSVRVFDDYAHHPTEVEATIGAARTMAGSGRVVVIFQPHLYSRTAVFAPQFAHALSTADVAVVLDVYGAREQSRPGVTGALIADAIDSSHTQVRYVPMRSDAAAAAAELIRDGDVVLTMGAGDVTAVASELVAALRDRTSPDPGRGRP